MLGVTACRASRIEAKSNPPLSSTLQRDAHVMDRVRRIQEEERLVFTVGVQCPDAFLKQSVVTSKKTGVDFFYNFRRLKMPFNKAIMEFVKISIKFFDTIKYTWKRL